MADIMEFPKTIQEFINDYSFKDKEEIYTNGSTELIPVFRIEQAIEYYAKEIRNNAIDEFIEECKKFGFANYPLNCIEIIAKHMKGGATDERTRSD